MSREIDSVVLLVRQKLKIVYVKVRKLGRNLPILIFVLLSIFKTPTTVVHTANEGPMKSNINIWFPIIYSQK
jgi:hypothetical protein